MYSERILWKPCIICKGIKNNNKQWRPSNYLIKGTVKRKQNKKPTKFFTKPSLRGI